MVQCEGIVSLAMPCSESVTALMCLSIWTPKIVNFPFGTNEKLMVLSVPLFKQVRLVLYRIGGLDYYCSFVQVSMSYESCHRSHLCLLFNLSLFCISHYPNMLKYWDTKKTLNFHLSQVENQ